MSSIALAVDRFVDPRHKVVMFKFLSSASFKFRKALCDFFPKNVFLFRSRCVKVVFFLTASAIKYPVS